MKYYARYHHVIRMYSQYLFYQHKQTYCKLNDFQIKLDMELTFGKSLETYLFC